MKLREAFERAVAPRVKWLGIEHFGKHGDAELSKIRSGDRRPTFEIVEAAFDEEPEALFAYVAARYGVKVEKPPEPVAVQLELFGARLHTLVTEFQDFAERTKAQERGAGMARVSSPPAARKRA